MMRVDYILGFKSGRTIRLSVTDGGKFVNDLYAGMRDNPGAPIQIYMAPGQAIMVSELEFVLPASAVAIEPKA